jgi:hypothetical protein
MRRASSRVSGAIVGKAKIRAVNRRSYRDGALGRSRVCFREASREGAHRSPIEHIVWFAVGIIR